MHCRSAFRSGGRLIHNRLPTTRNSHPEMSNTRTTPRSQPYPKTSNIETRIANLSPEKMQQTSGF